MIITIDGPSGTGKSTVARSLAKRIGFTYFDTGAMYRAFTYVVIKYNVDLADLENLGPLLDSFSYNIQMLGGEKRYFVGEEDVSEQIRSLEVTGLVSRVAAIPSVRHALVAIQKDFGHRVNAVFEGRDLGTVVFPDAELKIFITADPEVRAERRYKELQEKSEEPAELPSFEEILNQIKKRDELDSTRETSPLKRDRDAYLIDTTHMSIDDVVNAIMIYKGKVNAKRTGN